MTDFHGRHLLGSYSGCDPRALEDLPGLSCALRAAAEASGANVLRSVEHVFEPNAITVLLLLSESHASIHTYPEHGSCFVDLFTCGEQCRPQCFDECMREYLRPASWAIEIHDRGSDRAAAFCEARVRAAAGESSLLTGIRNP